jgi:hypothetical protein
MHKARLLARMALPPTHSNFPHPALIHAICAASAGWCISPVWEKSQMLNPVDFIQKDGLTFGMRQAAYAKDAVQDGLNTGNRLFDVVRAMVRIRKVTLMIDHP